MITPPPRTVLGTSSRTGPSRDRGFGLLLGILRRTCLATVLGILTLVACGDPNNPDATIGTLAGAVRDAETDAPIEGVTLVVAGIRGQTGSDGRFEIDSVPEGTQQVAVTMAGYVARTIEVQVQAGSTASLAVELVANQDPGPSGLTITTSALPQATVDLPYQASLEAAGGTPPYQWTWGNQGPPGLILDASGLVTGTPGFPAGTHPLRVAVRDAEGTNVWADITIEIVAASGLRVSSVELRVGEAGQPYADTLRAAGGEPPYTFDWDAPFEFEGLILEAATGALSGTPLRPTGPDGQPARAMVTVRDGVGASAIANVAIGIHPAPLVIGTEELPDGEVAVEYEAPLGASGGYGVRTWTVVSGTLPPGLGVISESLYLGPGVVGTPTTGGSFTFTLQVSDSRFQATREYTVAIADGPFSIVTSTLPDAEVGTPYSVFLVRDGGSGPFQWDVVSGSLPAGISLTAAGELTGTPTAPGDASFEVRVQDAGNQSATAHLALHVEP
jgi:hypothetical protein